MNDILATLTPILSGCRSRRSPETVTLKCERI
jgi:hypothetical protein